MFHKTYGHSHVPQDIRTVLWWLNINPKLHYFNCCLRCFALYTTDISPQRCNPLLECVPGTLDALDQNFGISYLTTNVESKPPMTCLQPLLCQKSQPLCKYAYQDFYHWLSRFVCQPSTEDAHNESLIKSCKNFNP